MKYTDQLNKNNTLKLRALLSELPSMCTSFFRGIEQRTQSRTRIAYCYDLKVFFEFLKNNNSSFKSYSLKDFRPNDIEKLTIFDLEEYSEYLKYRVSDSSEVINSPSGIKRKLCSLRTFYKYLYKNGLISKNPSELLEMPRIRNKEITRFDSNETADFLDEVEQGQDLSKVQAKFHEKTKLRDICMMTLMLGTGIRVSECIGLNISDVDFNNSGIKITRKGGKEATVYFGDEVESILREYIEYRKKILPSSGSEDALFLSLQNKRISARAVEYMVKKYSAPVTPLKHITPHKLRSTYGTQLYQETGDIYLVADVLGHNDVNTTRKHYAEIEDNRRRSARNKVKLREI